MVLETKKTNSKWGLLNFSVVSFDRNRQPINIRLAREVKRGRIAASSRGRSEFTGAVCIQSLFTTIVANTYTTWLQA